MDIFTFLIGICLVLTGAAFVGYPIGKIYGAREVRNALDEECDPYRVQKDDCVPSVVRAGKRRLDEKDVLNAETIEEFEIWDEIISLSPEAK